MVPLNQITENLSVLILLKRHNGLIFKRILKKKQEGAVKTKGVGAKKIPVVNRDAYLLF